jgi:hypothetical protein
MNTTLLSSKGIIGPPQRRTAANLVWSCMRILQGWTARRRALLLAVLSTSTSELRLPGALTGVPDRELIGDTP